MKNKSSRLLVIFEVVIIILAFSFGLFKLKTTKKIDESTFINKVDIHNNENRDEGFKTFEYFETEIKFSSDVEKIINNLSLEEKIAQLFIVNPEDYYRTGGFVEIAGNITKERINELLKQEISKLILTDIKDPRLGFVTVQRVETVKDMSYAKVYITVLGKESDIKRSVNVLNGASEYIRIQVGKKVDMRYMPNLEFMIDTKIDDTLKLLNLIENDKKEHGY